MGLYNEFKNSKVTAHGIPAKIMVIGVGGAGGNTVDHIFDLSIKGVNLLICNTDSKALDKSPLDDTQKICMGDGKGAGNDALVGQQKAKESLPIIREYVTRHNPDLIFLTAGMGGGTGTGAAPIVAQMINSLNIPLIAILTTPPVNEGRHRFEQAMNGIRIMQDFVDTFIIIRNETIIQLSDDRSVHDAFNMANDVVAYAAKGIAEIALTQSDLVSVDISDVCKVVRDSHYAVMGMASEAGENRVIKAIEQAVLSPLFGNIPIEGAKEVLVNFATSSPDSLKMKEVNQALDYIQQIAAGRDSNGDLVRVNIIWGTSIKPALEDKIEIIIVVTGFHADSYYRDTFEGKLELTLEDKVVIPAEPAVPTPPVVSTTAPVQPAVKPAVTPQSVTTTTPVVPAKPAATTPTQTTPTPQPKSTTTPAAQPEAAPVTPTPKPEPKPVAPIVPEPKPATTATTQTTTPPAPKPVAPAATTPATTPATTSAAAPATPTTPVAAVQTTEQSGEPEAWRVPIPERVAPKSIPPQRLSEQYKLDGATPAYKNRRGLMLINDFKGKKVIIRMDGSAVSNEEVVTNNPQQDFEF